MKLKIASGFEITITEEVAEKLSDIIRGFFMSVTDNHLISNKAVFVEAYERAKSLFLLGDLKLTNREYLNILPNDKFVDLVLLKQAEFHEKNFDPELNIFDITDGTRIDFEMWLEEKHI